MITNLSLNTISVDKLLSDLTCSICGPTDEAYEWSVWQGILENHKSLNSFLVN